MSSIYLAVLGTLGMLEGLIIVVLSRIIIKLFEEVCLCSITVTYSCLVKEHPYFYWCHHFKLHYLKTPRSLVYFIVVSPLCIHLRPVKLANLVNAF